MFKAIKEFFFGKATQVPLLDCGHPVLVIDTIVAPYKIETPTLVEAVIAALPKSKPLAKKTQKKPPVPAITGNKAETIAKRQERAKKKPSTKK